VESVNEFLDEYDEDALGGEGVIEEAEANERHVGTPPSDMLADITIQQQVGIRDEDEVSVSQVIAHAPEKGKPTLPCTRSLDNDCSHPHLWVAT